MASVYKSPTARQRIQDWCRSRVDAWPVAHRRSEVMTAAGTTSVVAAGPEPIEGSPTVMLVPGANMNTAVSLGLAESLAGRWHTVVVDVPGQPGLSADHRPRRDRTLWWGDWLAEILETVNRRTIVVGHSLGGAVALACPSPRIAGRVLISTAGLARAAVTHTILAATIPWLMRPTPERAAKMLRQMMPPGRPVPADLTEWMTLVARCCHATLSPSPLPAAMLAARRAVPNRVATGSHDVFFPPHRLAPAARRYLGTDVHTLSGAGHLVLGDQYGSVVSLVEEVWAANA